MAGANGSRSGEQMLIRFAFCWVHAGVCLKRWCHMVPPNLTLQKFTSFYNIYIIYNYIYISI